MKEHPNRSLPGIPVLLGLILYYLDGEFWIMPLFNDPIGWVLLTLTAGLILGGVVLMRKLTAIEE